MILSAGLGGLAAGLLAAPAVAAPTTAMPANLPLYFEAENNPVKDAGPFVTRGHDYQFSIAPAEVRMSLRNAGGGVATVRLSFAGANTGAQVHGDAGLPGRINYLTGNHPAQWRTGLPTFARVRVEELYPGVNLVYYGNQRQLEYDFTIAPGADPGAITMRFDGAETISINPQGELVVNLAGGEIRQPRPVIYQTIDGGRKEIEGGYRLVDARTVVFAVGAYDRRQPLTIDPVLAYSFYYGGNSGDAGYAVALCPVDTNVAVFIAGETFSTKYETNYPFAFTNAYQTNFAGGKLTGDAFVARFDVVSNGLSLTYLTYLGGNADDGAFSLAVDAAGDAYVTGFTDSSNFPTTFNPNATTNSGLSTNIHGTFGKSFGAYPVDAFVAELNPGGSNLIYSTYLGGSGMDCGMGIAVDASSNAYVTGFTYSSNFPAISAITYSSNSTIYTLPNRLACTNSFYFNANAFIAKIGPGGTNLVYSTYLGGTNFDEGKGIAVDTNGNVYVTGFTASTNFPTYNALSQQLVWTNIWTSNVKTNHVIVTRTNQVVITNVVNGSSLNGSTNKTAKLDAFVVKFDPTGTNLIYSTLLGGSNNDVATAIAVDNTGAAYVTGWTISSNFPNTLGISLPGLHSYVATNISSSRLATNAFLTKITNAIGTTNMGIAWSALFGGRGADVGYAVAVDPAGEVFVTGSASSTNFPVWNVPGLMRMTNSGKSDVFVIAFSADATNLLYSTYLGGKHNDYGYGIAVESNGDAYVVGQTLSTNFLTYNAGGFPRRLQGSNDLFLTKITLQTFPPVILDETGTNQATLPGTNVSMSVTVDGTPPFYYQWLKDGTNVVDDGTNIVGSTNSLLNFNQVQITNSGNYTVVITNFGGAATSSVYVLTVTNAPPMIGQQPTNQTVAVDATVTINVTVTNGSLPLSYRWQKDGVPLQYSSRYQGVNTDTLTINRAQTTNSGNFAVTITNLAGAVTSTNAVLTVADAPVIMVQPTNQAAAGGTLAHFSVTAVGTMPLRYHWQKAALSDTNFSNLVNDTNFSGVTSNVLTVGSTRTNDTGSYYPGNYRVIITNMIGSVTSAVAVLNGPPAIQVQPTNQSVAVGTSVVIFYVKAVGVAPLSYQWWWNGLPRSDGGSLFGTATNQLFVSNVQSTNAGTYSVVITNALGSVTSSVVVLTVTNIPPSIVEQPPTNQLAAVGSNVTLVVYATGTSPLSYQWLVDGTNNLVDGDQFSGSTNNVLTITNAQLTNSGTYSVIVSNAAGVVTSSNDVLTVMLPPAIIDQPTNQDVAAGATATFTVNASGTELLSYRWQKDGFNLADGGPISGAATNVLTISNVQTNYAGTYLVIITNAVGSVTSSNAILTVDPPLPGSLPGSGTVLNVAPSFNRITMTGDGFILSGVGGSNNGTYFVLASPSLRLALDAWTPILTNQFDRDGNFIFTNAAQTNTPQLFYRLQLR